MAIILDWNMIINTIITSSITGSVVGAITGITNWALNRHVLRRLEQLEDAAKVKHEQEEKPDA